MVFGLCGSPVEEPSVIGKSLQELFETQDNVIDACFEFLFDNVGDGMAIFADRNISPSVFDEIGKTWIPGFDMASFEAQIVARFLLQIFNATEVIPSRCWKRLDKALQNKNMMHIRGSLESLESESHSVVSRLVAFCNSITQSEADRKQIAELLTPIFTPELKDEKITNEIMNAPFILMFLMDHYEDLFVRDLFQEIEDLSKEIEALKYSLNEALVEVEEQEQKQVGMGKRFIQMTTLKSNATSL